MLIQTEIKVYKSRSELPAKLLDLLECAAVAARNAYAPYSHFRVGAAILLKNGHIITGNNQENAVYPVGMCAERVAAFYASAQFPEVPLSKIAITAIGSEKELEIPVPPCGACRQVLIEYEQKFIQPIEVILAGQKGEVFVIKSISDLLPLSFTDKFLE